MSVSKIMISKIVKLQDGYLVFFCDSKIAGLLCIHHGSLEIHFIVKKSCKMFDHAI